MKHSSLLTLFAIIIISSLPVHAGSDEEIYEADTELVQTTNDEENNLPQHEQKSKRKKLNLFFSTGKDRALMSIIALTTLLIIPDAITLWGKNNMINTSSPLMATPFRSENGTLMPPIIEQKPGCTYEEYIQTTAPDCTRGTCLCISNEKCYCIIENCDKTGTYKKACGALSTGPLMALSSKCAILVGLIVLTWVQCTASTASSL